MTVSLNFVWINAVREPSLKPEDVLSCPIPDLYRQNVSRIAQSMPSLPITIWIDVAGVGNNSVEIVEAVGGKSNIPQVTFRSLDEIPAYGQNPVFKKTSESVYAAYDALWQQVDLARLLVLDYCLISENQEAAIYSDFNREITPDTIKESTARLKNHGVVVGDGWQDPMQSSPFSEEKYCANFRVENQFMGFSQNKHSFLRDDVYRRAAHEVKYGGNGWDGVADAFSFYSLETYGLAINDIAITVPRIPDARAVKNQYGRLLASTPQPVQSAHRQP